MLLANPFWDRIFWDHAILMVENMKVWTCHFKWVPSPKSQVWHGCLHDNTFWRWGLGVVLRVGLRNNLDPTFSTSLMIIFVYSNQDLNLMIVNHILMVSWGSKVRKLPPCWDLLIRLGLGTWDPMWTNPNTPFKTHRLWTNNTSQD